MDSTALFTYIDHQERKADRESQGNIAHQGTELAYCPASVVTLRRSLGVIPQSLVYLIGCQIPGSRPSLSR